MKAKRTFDILASLAGIVIILPISVLIAVIIAFDTPGGVFYRQRRIGHHMKPFYLFKFRTMYRNSSQFGLLTVGDLDRRITPAGYYLRKYKLDELPQLINVLIGEMSFVGPRPEVPKYVELYSKSQLQVLNVKPGLTDPASISFFNENEILARTKDPEKTYITKIIPAKISQNLSYIEHQSFWGDLTIIFKTIAKVFSQTT